MTPMLSRAALRNTLLAGLLGTQAPGACAPGAVSVTVASISFPQGGPRVLVPRGGDARLYYGALPTFRPVEEGTFDLDALLTEMQGRLHPMVPAEERRPGAPWGIVTLGFEDGRARDHIVYDREWAEGVIRKACAHGIVTRASPSRPLYDRVCSDAAGGG